MKIDKVILSSDDNATYLDFWPIVSRIWRLKFNIEPVLLYFGDNASNISSEYGDIIKCDIDNTKPISIQVLWARYFFPSLDPESTCLISDIDMLPLSKYFFIDKIKDVHEDKYVHLNPCIETYGLISSCYHVAKGKNYKKILELPDTWRESLDQVVNSGFGRNVNGNPLWFADEEYATNKILNNKNKDQIVYLPREGGQNGRRIDRLDWKYYKDLISKEYYFDCHSLRPYSQYKKEIDDVVDSIVIDNNFV